VVIIDILVRFPYTSLSKNLVLAEPNNERRIKMKKILLALAACVFLTVSVGSADEKSCDQFVQDSEQLWIDGKFDESDKALDEVIKMCPDRAEAYWRKARNIYDRIEAIPRDQKPDESTLIEQYYELERLADKCSELDENEGTCYMWKGIGIGRRATTQGVLKVLWSATEIRDAWLKALSLNPPYRAKNGTANTMGDCNHALGMYYRVVPEWLCYFPLRQIFGTCGDKKKSVDYQRKAVALEPKRLEYLRGLGVSLLCYGQSYDDPEATEEGKKILQEMQSIPEIKRYDKIDKEHARMLLEDPSLACGYQRDEQQEQSEEAYEKENQ
jgi:tetratricopeptide (TPR) repeat protein